VNSLERKMEEQAWKFDIISFLRLVISVGYGPHEIRFEGHDTLCSQNRLIQRVRFYRDRGGKEVTITLSLGLLGVQSPLPSYFRKVLETDETSAESFARFIGFFDHHLIRNYLCAIYPELRFFFQGVPLLTMESGLQAFDIRSVSMLHVIFSRVFPEARIQVERRTLNMTLSGSSLSLGHCVLGHSEMLGKRTTISVYGRRIVLYVDEEVTDEQRPWAEEARSRLNRLLFPVLAPLAMELEIRLRIASRSRWVRLHPTCCLGYDTLKSPHQHPLDLCLFRGSMPQGRSKIQPLRSELKEHDEKRSV